MSILHELIKGMERQVAREEGSKASHSEDVGSILHQTLSSLIETKEVSHTKKRIHKDTHMTQASPNRRGATPSGVGFRTPIGARFAREDAGVGHLGLRSGFTRRISTRKGPAGYRINRP